MRSIHTHTHTHTQLKGLSLPLTAVVMMTVMSSVHVIYHRVENKRSAEGLITQRVIEGEQWTEEEDPMVVESQYTHWMCLKYVSFPSTITPPPPESNWRIYQRIEWAFNIPKSQRRLRLKTSDYSYENRNQTILKPGLVLSITFLKNRNFWIHLRVKSLIWIHLLMKLFT